MNIISSSHTEHVRVLIYTYFPLVYGKCNTINKTMMKICWFYCNAFGAELWQVEQLSSASCHTWHVPTVYAMQVFWMLSLLFFSLPQDYTATIYLRQRWTDPRLVFHGNKSFTLDARLVELLWVPDTYIVESKRSFLHDVTVGNRLIRLFSNGTILYALR